MNATLQDAYSHFKAFQIRPVGRPPRRRVTVNAFHIDHRKHMDLAWKRQLELENYVAQTESALDKGQVVEVQDLQHFDKCLELAGSRVAVLALYSRSCGVCKAMCRDLVDELAQECHAQQTGIVFLRHCVISEFDSPTDIAQMYRVKAVPRFLFAVDGAVVDSVSMADVRRIAQKEEDVVGYGRYKMKNTLKKLLIKYGANAVR